MPETFYTSSQYYNLFFQLYCNRDLSMPLTFYYPSYHTMEFEERHLNGLKITFTIELNM